MLDPAWPALRLVRSAGDARDTASQTGLQKKARKGEEGRGKYKVIGRCECMK